MKIGDNYAYSALIFVALISIIFWAYHRYKYSKSNYNKFEYYLNGKSVKDWLIVTEVLLCLIGVILLSGIGTLIIHYFIFK